MTPQSDQRQDLSRAAIGVDNGGGEAWLRAVVTNARRMGTGVELTLGDADAEAREAVRAFLAADRIERLEGELGIRDLPARLLGDEVELLLRRTADRGRTEIVAIGQAWLDRRRQEVFFDARSTLASMKGTESQRTLEMPGPLARIEVLHDPRHPSWPAVEARLGTLADIDLLLVACSLGGPDGTRIVDEHLFRRQRSIDGVDAIMIVADAAAPAGLPFLNDFGIASSAFELPMPILLGAPAPATGSLLHETVFAAADDAIGAADILVDLLADVLASRRRTERLRAMGVAPTFNHSRRIER